ncbi:DUF6597 domain-containing transcriptional factor [Paenibacillus hexagrammi]|uniref:DUF6597 domain-containing protein n=1 Tax=Paenibacillus hexagrammi TaxID=2908839 RepID=A0ABY3SIF5_9BACL|nr:DUF6597 domain-containing transcriptional factor [Paenibacillus sp. YPD9-1]UJF33006.1 hypothetical protein L0M14_26085 [Paenibacillus sp. YPD9-1]
MNLEAPMPSMGILHLQEGSKKFQLTRHLPLEDLAFFIKHFWIVSWDLTGQPPHPQHVVPNPCVNLVIENNRSACFGPSTSKFTYLVEGAGCVFGVKFKPGGFIPLYSAPFRSSSAIPWTLLRFLELEQLKSNARSSHEAMHQTWSL